MRVLHVPYVWAPDAVGGTEVFVEALAQALGPLGWESSIAAPAAVDARYAHEGVPVLRFAMGDITDDVVAQWGGGDPAAARSFARVLDEVRPDVVHLHALTPAASVRVAAEVKRRGVPLVVTYHTPTMSCSRGTLMRYGRIVCDGYLDPRRCSRCMYQRHDVPLPLAYVLGSLPPGVGSAIASALPARKARLAARLPALLRRRIAAFNALMEHADHVVAKCEWTHALLRRNGVPESRITRSPYGIAESRMHAPRAAPPAGPLRLAVLGRLSPEKGLHIVLDALRAVPQLELQLDVYAIVQPGVDAYMDEVAALIRADPRVSLKAPVAAADVVGLLSRYHALVVPSQWLETGPLVVLEAFAAGTPVLGSNLGGIAERVEHERTGLLVEARSVTAWREALERVVRDRALLERWRAQVQPPRSVAANAAEYAAVYAACLGRGGR